MSRTVFAWKAKQLANSFSREFLAPNIVRLKVPGGFPYESFNGEANINSWSLISFMESCWTFSIDGSGIDSMGSFLDFDVLYKDVFAFIASNSLKISNDFYNKDLPKSPLEITTKLIHVGNTTTSLVTKVSHPEIEKPLVEGKTQTICVGIKSRKPSPFPDWWKEKYQQYSQKNESLNWRLSESRPMVYTSYPLIIQQSDCDVHSHVNWKNYIKFCSDAFVGSNFKSNIGISELKQPHVKSAILTYLKESVVGKQLTVDFWTAKENRKQISFEILDERKDVVCQAQIELQTAI